MKEFDSVVRDFIRRQRLVERERRLLNHGDYEGRETLWDQALEELQDALSDAWNKEIEKLLAAGELEEE